MRMFVYKGYFIGVVCSIGLIVLLSLSSFQTFRMSGALHNGHETLACNECHQTAVGSFRQQIQANVRYLLGARSTSVAFNFVLPDNKDCLACHLRENDRHPVYRFNEPRFSEVRQSIQPQFCQSCHQQHKGMMFTGDVQNCRHCHQDMQLKNDPLEPSHVVLIKQKQWQSCLACHDFHANHAMKIPRTTKKMIDKEKLSTYLEGNANSDPYALTKITPAQETRYENKVKQERKTNKPH